MTDKIKNSQIIAVCGYKGSGKDTIAEYLSIQYDYEHIKISNKVKEIVKILFNITDEDYDNKKEEINEIWGVSIRQMMQFIGTDMFQYKIQELLPDINRNFWIKALLESEIKDRLYFDNDYKVVISDLRFMHEYMSLMDLDANVVIIKVENNNLIQDDNHISENEFNNIPYDYVVNNSYNIEDLYNQLDNIFNN